MKNKSCTEMKPCYFLCNRYKHDKNIYLFPPLEPYSNICNITCTHQLLPCVWATDIWKKSVEKQAGPKNREFTTSGNASKLKCCSSLRYLAPSQALVPFLFPTIEIRKDREKPGRVIGNSCRTLVRCHCSIEQVL
jgi:hypothetical protein